MVRRFLLLLMSLCATTHVTTAILAQISRTDQGKLNYLTDDLGNRILDFSYCGYQNSDRAIPNTPAKVVVSPSGGDDTQRIQQAIQFVSQLNPDEDGVRGAVLLQRGTFRVEGQLLISESGVVLRGHGAGPNGTKIHAVGTDRRALIRVVCRSKVDRSSDQIPSARVIDEYVPVGTRSLMLDSAEHFSTGTQVEIVHRSSRMWIERLGIDRLGWREGTRDIRWRRSITSVNGKHVMLDVPLSLALDETSQAIVRSCDDNVATQIGIEDLSLVSDFNHENRRDEEHAWFGIHMNDAQDCWVRRVCFRHFSGGAVVLAEDVSRVTVSDCASFDPISEVAGYRRNTFFTLGQQCLFARCWSELGINDFSAGHCSAGPNAFVNCYAKNALGDSGTIESLASGVLFDNVRIDGNDLNLMNRWNSPPKAGWSAVNCVLWQCQAANVRCDRTPVGNNWVIGVWATPAGDGHFEQLSDFVRPISLFQAQLNERLGDQISNRVGPFLLRPVGATNPTVEQARVFTEQSSSRGRQLIDLIMESWENTPKDLLSTDEVRSASKLQYSDAVDEKPAGTAATENVSIQNGWLTTRAGVLRGEYYAPMWWRGDLLPRRAKEMGPAITRFAPGRYGPGLTDDLEQVARTFVRDNVAGYDHHYGLWYDRRRDDHLMVQRADANVVPPFYEQPFARSGQGSAWDGVSRYDLTKPNPWYWRRLRRFAAFGAQYGFVLFHNHYFQHNVLEAGAHWADSPWRPTNNVNDTVFPEPPPYVGDKRIFLAEQFYDVTNERHRELHRRYIRMCLTQLAGHANVVQLTSGEYTGSVEFMRFWIDTVGQWERENGKAVVVALSCTKDVQDAILADPDRAEVVDVIDIRYWTYTANGELYAPRGDQSLSPRQHLRRMKPDTTSFDSIARSVLEYSSKYPNKAVTYHADLHCRARRNGWAILMGGGSMPNIPELPTELAQAIVTMKPSDIAKSRKRNQWSLANSDGEQLVYSQCRDASRLELMSDSKSEWCLIDPATGRASSFQMAADSSVPVPPGEQVVFIRSADAR